MVCGRDRGTPRLIAAAIERRRPYRLLHPDRLRQSVQERIRLIRGGCNYATHVLVLVSRFSSGSYCPSQLAIKWQTAMSPCGTVGGGQECVPLLLPRLCLCHRPCHRLRLQQLRQSGSGRNQAPTQHNAAAAGARAAAALADGIIWQHFN